VKNQPAILHQLFGLIRYELLMHWRRRGLPLSMVLWLVGVSGGGLLLKQGLGSVETAATLQSPTLARLSNTYTIGLSASSVSTIFAVFVLAVLCAETLPLDRQLGAREWLQSLPLGNALYLLGKLLGVWVMVIVGLIGIGSVGGGVNRLLNGAFDWGLYGWMWGTIILPIALCVSGLSVLLAVTLARRRLAPFLGVGLALVIYIFLVPALLDHMAGQVTRFIFRNKDLIVQEMCRSQPADCQTLTAAVAEGLSPAGNAVTLSRVSLPQLFLIGAALLVVVGGLAWLWLRWREEG